MLYQEKSGNPGVAYINGVDVPDENSDKSGDFYDDASFSRFPRGSAGNVRERKRMMR
jgi:hypothetical protein